MKTFKEMNLETIAAEDRVIPIWEKCKMRQQTSKNKALYRALREKCVRWLESEKRRIWHGN